MAQSPRLVAVTTIYTPAETPILDAELFDNCPDFSDDLDWQAEYSAYLDSCDNN